MLKTILLILLMLPSVHAEVVVSELQSLGEEPNAIISFDSNADGILDSVVVGTVSKAISVGSSSWEIFVSSINAISSADLDEDGYLDEVVIAGRDLVAVDPHGGEIWRSTDVRGYSVAPADLNKDGYKNEVIVGAWNKIFAFDSTGNILWNYSEIAGNVRSLAVIDGYIIAGVGRTLLWLDYYGTLRRSKVLPENIVALAPIDIESTGKKDGVVAVSFDGDSNRAYARVYDKYANEKGLKFERYYERETDITIFPIDKYSRGKFDHATFNLDDGIFWVNSKGTAGSITGIRRISFSPADFDGDGILDDIIATKDATDKNPGSVIAYNAFGIELARSNASGGSKIAAIDFNFDGKADDAIVASSFDRRIYSVITQVSDTTTSTAPQTTQPPTTTPPPTQAPTTAPPQAIEISVDLGPDKTISVGEEITLSPTAIPSTTGGRIVSYIWTEEGKFLGDTPSITLTLEEGTHNITVKVTDDSGASATDSILVTVNPKPTSPEVDSDTDGLSDQQEEILGTDPHNPDTDGDGIIDSKDPNPLAPGGGSLLPLEELKPLLKYLKWIAIAAVGIFLIIYIREKILDFLWERQQDWGE
jgi:hypothetical protein